MDSRGRCRRDAAGLLSTGGSGRRNLRDAVSARPLLVAERANEIGIRMALGADRRAIIASVLREGLSCAAGGIPVGLAGALFAARALETLLYGMSAFDPRTFAIVPAILGSVALPATWAPAYRAASVNFVMTLRHG